MADVSLTAQQRDRALAYLVVTADVPSIDLLRRLIRQYVQNVPWESASRIAKKARTGNLLACPRWPGEFWDDAIQRGTGGTCFESNLALWSVLSSLGFDGYLTVNNMQESIACHTAVVVTLAGEKWLVDAGYPVYEPLKVVAGGSSQTATPWIVFTATSIGDDRYEITRAPHPGPYCFTLIDVPVDIDSYCAATARDYGADGLFLDRIIVNKVVNHQLWRFNAAEPPPALLLFDNGTRSDHAIEGDVTAAVAAHFGMDVTVLRAAFEALSG
jgi:hypothetical protein